MLSPPVKRLLLAKGLRAFGDGFVSLLLPLYLLQLGFTPFKVGVIATTTLAGTGVLTLMVGLWAHRYSQRGLLLAATLLTIGTGAGFALSETFWPLLIVAFAGTLNPSGGDVSVFLPVEHGLLSRLVADRDRTRVLAWYSVIGALMSAAGALSAALPAIIAHATDWSAEGSMQGMFWLYAALGFAMAWVYSGLPKTGRSHDAADSAQTESAAGQSRHAQPAPAATPPRRVALGKSKRHVQWLAALFSLDAFGGGFMVQSLLALWMFQRFHLSAAAAGSIFFWAGLLTAGSFFVAVRIAGRIGLVNTMVYTQMGSNICLLLIPFMPSIAYVVALFFVRSALSQMDVPTRSSYVLAIVPPAERPAAASLTAVPRSLASAASPFLAGYLLSLSPFGWQIIAASLLKSVYCMLLLRMFRKVKPPEEAS